MFCRRFLMLCRQRFECCTYFCFGVFLRFYRANETQNLSHSYIENNHTETALVNMEDRELGLASLSDRSYASCLGATVKRLGASFLYLVWQVPCIAAHPWNSADQSTPWAFSECKIYVIPFFEAYWCVLGLALFFWTFFAPAQCSSSFTPSDIV